LLNDGNKNSLTRWETGLRDYKKYSSKNEIENEAK
jgi:hypothetical protein